MPSDIWCVAEQRRGTFLPTIQELLSIGKKLARELQEKLTVITIGSGVESAAREFGKYGAERVLVVDHPALAHYTDEGHARALAEVVRKEDPRALLFPCSANGRSWAGRCAVLLEAGLGTDVTELTIDPQSKTLKMVRPCCGASLLMPLSCRTRFPQMAAVRPGAFPRAEIQAGKTPEVRKIDLDPSRWKLRTQFKGFEEDHSQVKDIAQAEIIVSGGYGVGGADGFSLLEELAKLLGGAVGASRRAVDLGWIPYRHQVGLTGRTIKPRLYIACGISGQIQHLAGMSQSDVIVAINKDSQAPLMKLCNYAVEGDLFELLPALIEEIKKSKG
ncbi:MAG: electron transfer flavoprotein subunit alpha/FixB family protein [Elusimicrobia bacterium]|nr:electron transfer flavoprotein subunit alpha/FixB family protein [Elusimicrobiota bacterium]